MIPPQVTIEWRRGVDGTDGTYTFSPIPTIQRNSPNKRQAAFILPLSDGAVIQLQGLAQRTIVVKGVLFTTPVNFLILDQKRKDLASGIGTGPGQLHIIAAGNHVFYKAIPTPEGVQFDNLERANLLTYTISLTTADPTEYTV